MKELAEFKWPEYKHIVSGLVTMEAPVQLELLSRMKPYTDGYKAFNAAFFTRNEFIFSHELVGWEQKAFEWAICFMSSFTPKHEHKTSICAMIFEELGVSVVKG